METTLANKANYDHATSNFVTVVSVGTIDNEFKLSEHKKLATSESEYVTVLTIGERSKKEQDKDAIEDVLVYRLPGERLGFGLKFEGGTKANEFVKKLFIQSCAPDSPASRVTCSWGSLVEGDQVLEIDSIPVNTMTRIDCVRCLKDSNVVIKLLVRHTARKNKVASKKEPNFEPKTKSSEDLPLVVCAEKKRTPPPPPPVPPRKIPRKLFKNKSTTQTKEPSTGSNSNPSPPLRQKSLENNTRKLSTTNSFKIIPNPPEIPVRIRKYSDSSIGPPDAEVYVDLISQESTQSLSESDDTGSTISTVIDRTTSSSLAGSLPSTPTAKQKQLGLPHLLNSCEDEEIIDVISKKLNNNTIISPDIPDGKRIDDTCFSSFQDASLSYGDEDVLIPKQNEKESVKIFVETTAIKNAEDFNKNHIDDSSLYVTDEMKNLEFLKDITSLPDENMNVLTLPRLVDFVPKTTFVNENQFGMLTTFLENERNQNKINSTFIDFPMELIANDCHSTRFDDAFDMFSTKWRVSPQLATIGEVDEETNSDMSDRPPIEVTPIVIIEQAEEDVRKDDQCLQHGHGDSGTKQNGFHGNMDTLPSDSRQPPDGHEFPDYEESFKSSPANLSHKTYQRHPDLLNELSHSPLKTNRSEEAQQSGSDPNQLSNDRLRETSSLSKVNSLSNNDLSESSKVSDNKAITSFNGKSSLHGRSQSLCDITTIDKRTTEHWIMLAEQRRKGLSKLKGLVIPDMITENEQQPVVNIPEIKSEINVPIEELTSLNTSQFQYTVPPKLENIAMPLPISWNDNFSDIPKYSPAFKRKELRLYTPCYKIEKPKVTTIDATRPDLLSKHSPLKQTESEDCVNETSPKSLDSSPTRSDYSFEYTTPQTKLELKNDIYKCIPNNASINSHTEYSKNKKDLFKGEEESDNDSAVSSSQSSYISRPSPAHSPTRSYHEYDHMSARIAYESNSQFFNQNRCLKPSSIEAINRKNILASAKCRSGKDLKIGSPIINRKADSVEDNAQDETDCADLKIEEITENANKEEEEESVEKLERRLKLNKEETNVNSSQAKNNKDALQLSPRSSTPKLPAPVVNSNRLSSTLQDIKTTKKDTFDIKDKFAKYSSFYKNKNRVSVNDLRKNFECGSKSTPPMPQQGLHPKPVNVPRAIKPLISSQTSFLLHKSSKENHAQDNSKLSQETKTQHDSTPKRRNVVLHPDPAATSLGITLSGGREENLSFVTIQRIRYGSVAYQNKHLTKDDRIISINGKSTNGLTKSEVMEILNEKCKSIVLMIEYEEECKSSASEDKRRKLSLLENTTLPEILPKKTANHTIQLVKDSAGLGFSIEGGKGSLQGDVPLVVKRIFQGGVAEKAGKLLVGDELLSINEHDLTNMSSIRAWNLMKKLPEGNVILHIYR